MHNSGIDLDEYREKINLDSVFGKYSNEELKKTPIKSILGNIISEITQEKIIQNPPDNSSVDVMRDLLYSYIITRHPRPIPQEIISDINFILQKELSEKIVTHDEDIQVAFQVKGMKIKVWRGDISTLGVDAIVNAANNRLLGCWVPHHLCIDNVIHANSGPQVRDDCYTIMNIQGYLEPIGEAKITRAYNLPSKYILHTVGPIWDLNAEENKKEQFRQDLANSYLSCLNLVSQMPDIQSIAFCCISTGEFGFPQDIAADIAFNTVLDWCKTNEKSSLKTIVFNTFLERDDLLYRVLIKQFKMMN